jgi:hypothetical protein
MNEYISWYSIKECDHINLEKMLLIFSSKDVPSSVYWDKDKNMNTKSACLLMDLKFCPLNILE